MAGLLEILGSFILFLGTLFLLLGGLGLVRMPDTFTRIQAGTKATTLGTLAYPGRRGAADACLGDQAAC